MESLAYAGYILALIGGIIIVIVSLFNIIGSPFLEAYSITRGLGALASGVVGLIIGIICILGSKYVGTLVWAIVLLILGLIVAVPGGILVVIGAILGLISALTRHNRL